MDPPDRGPNAERTVIIVRAYNEAATVGSVIAATRRAVPRADIVVVNDGSHDATADEARRAGASVLSHAVNLGMGAAVQTGYLYAIEGGYDTLVQIDADGQHDPDEIPRLLNALRDAKADLVIGSRFAASDREGFRSSVPRRIGIALFSRFLSLLMRQRVTDATSGFRAMRRRLVRRLVRLHGEEFFEVEAILLTHRWGMRLVEVPVRMRERQAGVSTIGQLRSIFVLVKIALALFVELLRRTEESD